MFTVRTSLSSLSLSPLFFLSLSSSLSLSLSLSLSTTLLSLSVQAGVHHGDISLSGLLSLGTLQSIGRDHTGAALNFTAVTAAIYWCCQPPAESLWRDGLLCTHRLFTKSTCRLESRTHLRVRISESNRILTRYEVVFFVLVGLATGACGGLLVRAVEVAARLRAKVARPTPPLLSFYFCFPTPPLLSFNFCFRGGWKSGAHAVGAAWQVLGRSRVLRVAEALLISAGTSALITFLARSASEDNACRPNGSRLALPVGLESPTPPAGLESSALLELL